MLEVPELNLDIRAASLIAERQEPFDLAPRHRRFARRCARLQDAGGTCAPGSMLRRQFRDIGADLWDRPLTASSSRSIRRPAA
jgi:hypothetical protein